MSQRALTALGTGSQAPSRERNHGGYFLHWDGEGILLDPGEGTQRQMIYAGISASQITKILITHFHGDHCLGLAGIIQRIALDRVTHPVEIFYPACGKEYVYHQRHAASFHDQAPLEEHPFEHAGVIFEDACLSIETRPLEHPIEAWGYRIMERPRRTMIPACLRQAGVQGEAVSRLKAEGRLEAAGRTVRLEEVSRVRPGQCVAFVMDTRMCRAAVELARGADLLVCEATYLSDRQEKAALYGHLTASQAGQIACEAGAGLLVLTHFSQAYRTTQAFVDEARVWHAAVCAAHDLARIALPRRQRDLSAED